MTLKVKSSYIHRHIFTLTDSKDYVLPSQRVVTLNSLSLFGSKPSKNIIHIHMYTYIHRLDHAKLLVTRMKMSVLLCRFYSFVLNAGNEAQRVKSVHLMFSGPNTRFRSKIKRAKRETPSRSTDPEFCASKSEYVEWYI